MTYRCSHELVRALHHYCPLPDSPAAEDLEVRGEIRLYLRKDKHRTSSTEFVELWAQQSQLYHRLRKGHFTVIASELTAPRAIRPRMLNIHYASVFCFLPARRTRHVLGRILVFKISAFHFPILTFYPSFFPCQQRSFQRIRPPYEPES